MVVRVSDVLTFSISTENPDNRIRREDHQITDCKSHTCACIPVDHEHLCYFIRTSTCVWIVVNTYIRAYTYVCTVLIVQN